MDIDLIALYIVTAYALVFLTTIVGSFDHRYKANFMQSVALALLCFWSVWRIGLIWSEGWNFPHEPLLATALLCHCIGSITKTLFWKEKK